MRNNDEGAGPDSAASRLELPGFEEDFRRESADLAWERVRQLVWADLLIYPAFWFLDLQVAPDLALRFLAVRAAVVVIYLIDLVVLRTPFGRRATLPVVIASALLSAAGISVMASDLGGFGSNYFVGNIIVIVALGFFLPWGSRAAAMTCFLIVLAYTSIILVSHEPSGEMAPPILFLVGMSIFTVFAAVALRRTRRRDLSLRLQLERANGELKKLDQAKSRFFANVSHELRAPLTMLFGPLQTLADVEKHEGRRTP